MKVRIVLLMILLLSLSCFLTAQEVSEKKEIAILGLGYQGWSIAEKYPLMADEEIKNVFINLGRFNVIGMSYRLEAGEVSQFIDLIRESKATNYEMPEEVKLGKVAFTEADFNRITGSFIVVVPVISNFVTETTDDGKHKCTIETGFTFIDVSDSSAMAHFTVKTSGFDEKPEESVKDAVDSIAEQLTFEIRSIEEFKIKTGVLEVQGNTVILEFGENMGVVPGDEYAVRETRVLSTGHAVPEDTGLILIKEVSTEVSYGTIIFTDNSVYPGSQLVEIPRMGVDFSAYAHGSLDLSGYSLFDDMSASVGVKAVYTRGFYKFHPFVGLEMPFSLDRANVFYGIPLNIYVGADWNWYLRRLQITPSVAVGPGISIPLGDTEDFDLTHAGGLAMLTVSYLFNPNMRLYLDAGYTRWFEIGLDPNLFSYGGVTVGAGMIFKQ